MRPAFIDKLIGRMERVDARSVASIVEQLAQEKGFFETVFNALNEGVLVLNAENKTIYLNRAARELLGLTPEFGDGDSVQRHLPDHFWKAIEEDRRSTKFRAAVHHDVEIFYPEHRFLQIYVTAMAGDHRTGTDSLFIIQDVTTAHRRAALNVESERTEAVMKLAAGVAHEIGNPLNSVHIYMQLMERELRNPEEVNRQKLQDHLRVCLDEIRRLDQIVNQFLKAVRPTRPVLDPRSVNEIVLEVLEVLGPEIGNRDVLVEKDLARNLPMILADRNQLKQVFFNVIRNSLQAMSKGGILHLRSELNSERVMVSIRDTGGGIPPEVLQRIFDPYFTTKSEGSGLGLMIVQRIVREHGGLIEVSSEHGRSTTFRISLPVAERRVRLLAGEASTPAPQEAA